MESKINNIHDVFIKELFSNKEVAIAFLESSLAENLKNELDLQSLSYEKNSFITPDLKEQISDIIFKIKLKKKSNFVFVSLILEHKSYVDKMVLFQILGYIANGYLTQIKIKRFYIQSYL